MKKWTSEEIKILCHNYQIKSHEDLCHIFPDRTWHSITHKGNRLKLSFNGTPQQRFWKYIDKKSKKECWNWVGSCNNHGYGQIEINNKKIKAYRLSWEIHFGKIPDKICVLHKCDNRKCVNPSHLFLGTYKDNSDDMILKDRQIHPQGENHRMAKLINDQVKKIRDLKGKLTQREIAKMFSVYHTTITKIHNNQIWKHIK